jgi:hypothetical protein
MAHCAPFPLLPAANTKSSYFLQSVPSGVKEGLLDAFLSVLKHPQPKASVQALTLMRSVLQAVLSSSSNGGSTAAALHPKVLSATVLAALIER